MGSKRSLFPLLDLKKSSGELPKLAEKAPELAPRMNRLVLGQHSNEESYLDQEIVNCTYPLRNPRAKLQYLSQVHISFECWVFFCKRTRSAVKAVFLQALSPGAGFLTYFIDPRSLFFSGNWVNVNSDNGWVTELEIVATSGDNNAPQSGGAFYL